MRGDADTLGEQSLSLSKLKGKRTQTPVWIVDAFTDRPFAGNPAGVCLLQKRSWPDEDWMQRVAAELNSETAFVYPPHGSVGEEWALRWFTPYSESNICGHATLAMAHVLYSLRPVLKVFSFHSPAGILGAHVSRRGATITLDFPVASLTQVSIPPGLAEALGTEPISALRTGRLGDLLVRLRDEDDVRALRPKPLLTAELCRREALRGIIVTAAAMTSDCGYNFVSRYFAPGDPLVEDAVTGSAHTALAPYWSPLSGSDTLTGLQASIRSGLVHTELNGDRVLLIGSAVTVLQGFITLPVPSV
jgi:PhzF family phenazine biosynthesis protein